MYLAEETEMKKIYVLEDLDCANCAAKIEEAVKKIDGVISASVSFMTQKLVLEAEDVRLEEIDANLEKIIKLVDDDITLRR